MALRGCGSILGVASRRAAGYEYHHRFSIDDKIAPFYKFEIHRGEKTYLFENRASFILKTINGGDQIMDSKRFDGRVYGDCHEVRLMLMVEYRLAEYWMTKDEIVRLVHEACDFAIRTANNPKNAYRSLIPVVVHLDVCTVQQENEAVDSVNDRAITAEKLVPFYFWPKATGVEKKETGNCVGSFVLNLVMARAKVGDVVDRRWGIRRRIRVEDVEEGLKIMPSCDICPDDRELYIGAAFVQSCFSYTLHREKVAAGRQLLLPYLSSFCVSVRS